jgi:hypothetical protein
MARHGGLPRLWGAAAFQKLAGTDTDRKAGHAHAQYERRLKHGREGHCRYCCAYVWRYLCCRHGSGRGRAALSSAVKNSSGKKPGLSGSNIRGVRTMLRSALGRTVKERPQKNRVFLPEPYSSCAPKGVFPAHRNLENPGPFPQMRPGGMACVGFWMQPTASPGAGGGFIPRTPGTRRQII